MEPRLNRRHLDWPLTKSRLMSGDDVTDGKRTSAPANTPRRDIRNCTRPARVDVVVVEGSVWLMKDPSAWSSDSADHWPCRWTCTACHAPSDTFTALSETSLSPPRPPRLYRKRIRPSTICVYNRTDRLLASFHSLKSRSNGSQSTDRTDNVCTKKLNY